MLVSEYRFPGNNGAGSHLWQLLVEAGHHPRRLLRNLVGLQVDDHFHVEPQALPDKVLQVGNPDWGGEAGAERMLGGQAELLQAAQGPAADAARPVGHSV